MFKYSCENDVFIPFPKILLKFKKMYSNSISLAAVMPLINYNSRKIETPEIMLPHINFFVRFFLHIKCTLCIVDPFKSKIYFVAVSMRIN